MGEPYLKLMRENCSEALHIFDRLHIVANMNKALDQRPCRGNQQHETPGPISSRSPVGCFAPSAAPPLL